MLLLALMLCTPGVAAPATAAALSHAYADVAAKAVPAVVHLKVRKCRTTAPDLQELWAYYGLPRGSPVWSDDVTREATGSGAIVTANGLVYTNHHVVESAVDLSVVLADGRVLPAHIVGSDPRTDLAVVQLDAPGPFPHLRLADSDGARVGDLVVAIGNPFEFESTVTVGVISARGRRGLSGREIQDYLQTDAAVNPGNSGGPLLDMSGDLLGINTAIFAPSAEQNSGISFAIPSNMVARVADQLEAKGHVTRSWIGVAASPVEEVAGDPTRRGAEIERVLPGSPAEKAGLRRGDVVFAVDRHPVDSAKALRADVLAHDVAQPLTVSVDRGGVPVDVPVHAVDEHAAGTALTARDPADLVWDGITLVDATPALLAALGVPAGPGVLVTRVDPTGAGARMGLVAGDRVVEVARVATPDVAALTASVAKQGKQVVVTFERQGGRLYAVLPGTAP